LLLSENMKLSANIILFYLTVLLTRSCLVRGEGEGRRLGFFDSIRDIFEDIIEVIEDKKDKEEQLDKTPLVDIAFSPPQATPKVTAESQSITGAEAVALTSGVAAQVLGAAIDTTLLQVSGAVDGAVGLSEPPVITGDNFQVVSTQLKNAQFILDSISGLADNTGGQGVAPIEFTVIPPP
jgi:hypothetical protein